jgi:hypothetical protein
MQFIIRSAQNIKRCRQSPGCKACSYSFPDIKGSAVHRPVSSKNEKRLSRALLCFKFTILSNLVFTLPFRSCYQIESSHSLYLFAHVTKSHVPHSLIIRRKSTSLSWTAPLSLQVGAPLLRPSFNLGPDLRRYHTHCSNSNGFSLGQYQEARVQAGDQRPALRKRADRFASRSGCPFLRPAWTDLVCFQ